jgi:hypothetical protein
MNTKLISIKSRNYFNLFVISAVLISQLNAGFQAVAASGRDAPQQPPAVVQQTADYEVTPTPPTPVGNEGVRPPNSQIFAPQPIVDQPAADFEATLTPLDPIDKDGVVAKTDSQEVGNAMPVIVQGDVLKVNVGQGEPLNLTLNAVTPDKNDTLTWRLMTPAKHGSASVESQDTSASVVYVSEEGYEGTDVFAVQVLDSQGGRDSIVIELGVLSASTLSEVLPVENPQVDDNPVQVPELPAAEMSANDLFPYMNIYIDSTPTGYDWPLGNSLTVTIDDPSNGSGVDYSQTKTVLDTYVDFDVPPDGIKQGYIVTMTDGTTTKSLAVAQAASNFDATTDTISGKFLGQ